MVPHRNRYYLFAFIGTLAILVAPLFQLSYVPLVDFPSHLVRCFILYHYHDVPAFQQTYQVLYEPIPNVACDIIITSLLHVFNVLTAGRLFIGLIICLYALGCHLLAAELQGRPSWIAIPCAFTVYSSPLMWGLVNYVLGLALFMICVAVWMRWRPSWSVGRYLLVTALVSAAFLTHLTAYGFLGITFAIMTGYDLVTQRRTIVQSAGDLGVLVPPLIAFAVFMTKSGSVGSIQWSTVAGKIGELFPFFRAYNLAFDLLFLITIALSILVFLWRSSRVRPMWPVTITAAVFAALFLACPRVLFTSSGADARFVPPAILLFVLSLRVEVPKRTEVVIVSIVLMASVLRVGLIRREWMRFDDTIGQAVRLTDAIPAAAKVYPAMFPMECLPSESTLLTKVLSRSHGSRVLAILQTDECRKRDVVFEHILEYATIRSSAFVPSLHAHRGQQPLVFRTIPRYRSATMSLEPDWMNDARDYDFIWSYAMPEGVARELDGVATPVAESGEFALWKVNSHLREHVSSRSIPRISSWSAESSITTKYEVPNGGD
jgi:hypothetical protein